MVYHRTLEQLQQHYEVEKELADKLRRAPKEERRYLYGSLYDELYQRVPHHPQLQRKKSAEDSATAIRQQMVLLRPLLKSDSTFMEIGPGDCSLSFEVARFVKEVYAVDVSDEITKADTTLTNFQLVLSDGSSIPMTPNSISIAYSNQLMEHLHPDDALDQLQNIYAAIANGGCYICVTPNKLTGPHDISRNFDKTATGFHLKEYTVTELRALFQEVGFANIGVYTSIWGKFWKLPVQFIALCERILSALPSAWRRPICRSLPFRKLLECHLVAWKTHR